MQFKIYDEKVACVENEEEVGAVTFPQTEQGIFDINHTFVDISMQGKGIAAKLVRLAINEINRKGGEIKTSCSYARKFVEKNSLRPLVICHMVTSIDGRVTGKFLDSKNGETVCKTYYEINRRLKGDAFACGRVTMESSFTKSFKPDLSRFKDSDIPCEDYIAMKHSYYAVSFDPSGKVGWTDSRIYDEDEGYDDCHIIEVITEKTPKEVLAYYRSIGVSYIFAGSDTIDINIALEKLYTIFGIKKLLLEGGSIINGAFLRAGAVDELSLVVSPLVADKSDKSLFMDADMCEFSLIDVEPMSDGSVWMRYRK